MRYSGAGTERPSLSKRIQRWGEFALADGCLAKRRMVPNRVILDRARLGIQDADKPSRHGLYTQQLGS